MSAATTESAWYQNPENWTKILAGASEGGIGAMHGATKYATSKEEAKEAKRRTIANLLSATQKRKRGLSQAQRDSKNDLRDYQNQSMQQVARGFVQALQGTTG